MNMSGLGLSKSIPGGWLSRRRSLLHLLVTTLTLALSLSASSAAVAEDLGDPSQSVCANDSPPCKFLRCSTSCPKPIFDCQSNLEWVKCIANCACQVWGKECDSSSDMNCPNMRESNSRSGRNRQGSQDRVILSKILDRPLSSVALFLQVQELIKDRSVCVKADAPAVCELLCPQVPSGQATFVQVLYSQLAQAAGVRCR